MASSVEPAEGQRGGPMHMMDYPPGFRLTVGLVLVARRWRALVDENLREIDQSSARMEALSAIDNAKAPRSQVDVAKRLRIEGPTMTRMIDTLSNAGLVERNPSPTDRRTNHLDLTDKGRAASEDIASRVEPLRAKLLAGMSDDEIERMNDLLLQMLDRLDEGLR